MSGERIANLEKMSECPALVLVKVVRLLVEPIRGTVEAMKKDFVKQNNKLVLRP